MKELPPELYERCYDLLSECDELDSDESLQSVFAGTEIESYRIYINKRSNRGDRISEVIRVLKNKRYRGGSVLALFLEALGKRYPDGDDTRKELERLAHDVDTALSRPMQSLLGSSREAKPTSEEGKSKQEQVLVIWGQNDAARIEIFEFLKGANLWPVEWEQIEASLEKNSPSIDEILRTAFDTVQAVLVVFTGDDIARPKRKIADKDNGESEKKFDPQPGLVILFKAGVAFGMDQTRTILVALGRVRLFNASLERHVIRLTNEDESRKGLIAKLNQAHCTITGYEWTVRGNFNNPSFY